MHNKIMSESIIDNFRGFLKVAVSSSAGHELTDWQGSLRYFSGCEFPFFNGFFYEKTTLEIQDNLFELSQFFGNKKTPFIWWWTESNELPTEIKQALEKEKFQSLGEFLGMGVKLDEANLHLTTDDIQVIHVVNEEEYQQFLTVLCDVFKLSDAIKRNFAEMYQSYGPQGKFKHYLGFYKNKPVATLTSFIDGNIVGLYNGATLSNYTKQGLCTALAKTAMQEAINLGCEYAISQLMDATLTKNLSEKIGFKQYRSLLPYLKQP